jgi:hypothetical protein
MLVVAYGSPVRAFFGACIGIALHVRSLDLDFSLISAGSNLEAI